ncbi:LuxR C-terminal-related transcriptional regulator, partial [Escherichia coli]
DRNRSHWSTSKTPSYTKSVSWQHHLMRYILDGKDNNDIAEKMFISNKTVSNYKSRLMEKLECKSLMDLYTFAQRNKIG